MDYIICLLKNIPDVIWSAVIASLLTLSGVLLTSFGNTKRLKSQLLHDSQQRDKERDLSLRKQVYLDTMEAIANAQNILLSLLNIDFSEIELSSRFSETFLSINKCYVIASNPNVVKGTDRLLFYKGL